MKARQNFKVMATVLVALVAGTQSVFGAWAYEWENGPDTGGGKYRFRSEKSYINGYPSYNVGHLKTLQFFDVSKDQFEYQFSIGVYPTSLDLNYATFEGEVYVVSPDDVMYKLATWKKFETPLYSQQDMKLDNRFMYGHIEMGDVKDAHNLLFIYKPTNEAFTSGLKCIVFKTRFYYDDGKQRWDSGWFQYEKDLDLSSVTESSPMPKLNIEWTEFGEVGCRANVPDKRDNNAYHGQFWDVFAYYSDRRNYRNATTPFFRSFSTKPVGRDDMKPNLDISSSGNGKMDLSFNFRMLASFTVPVYIEYKGGVTCPDGEELTYILQPKVAYLLRPFTRPLNVRTEFDKWKKKALVRWSRMMTSPVRVGTENQDVECRTDGKWYLIRYEQGTSRQDYTLVASLDGTETNLQVVDSSIEYDKNYVYRVIFLPALLNAKYSENLANIPGQTENENEYNLWSEGRVSSKLEMPIRLRQDRKVESSVHLVWDYCTQPTGSNWTIEYSPAGKNEWRVMDSSLQVDPDKAQVSYDAEGTVCDLMDYRVKTTYMNRDHYSNTITGNLPAGSYISEVKATTGTEEKNVIVKWKVARADMNNEIYYRVLRRPIGSDEWTVITEDVHGTASEYTYIDDRVMAGSYYEYTVEAYGAKCDEQLVKTDEQTTPGFSQARGTITGHISFGSGTAVRNVQVNLVKTTTDEATDQPQFLSRFIEGPGQGLQWTADSAKYAGLLNGNQEMTIQMWVRPQETEGKSYRPLFVLDGALEVGVQTENGRDYSLCVYDGSKADNTYLSFAELTFAKNDFTHVAASYAKGNWTLYTGEGRDTLLHSKTISCAKQTWKAIPDVKSGRPTFSVGGSNTISNESGIIDKKPFEGFVDDIRIWNRALSEEKILANYKRILGGTEEGLILYWPLDEGINVKKYVFDVSCQDGLFQLNHPEVGVNALPSAIVPKELGLYGVTDDAGDYIIRGIPFQQGGTNYKVVPMLGIHEFNPNSRSMFISPTSLTANNIDYEDVSAFPMTGHIYYAGTNIPAEGIPMYVDGLVQSKDGKFCQTDASGYYEISVPIGKHFVEAKLDGHKMVAGGRFPLTGTYNFDRAVSCDFADSTLVNFVGRVAGGERNDTLGVGFGASNNNIGIATITLKLNNESSSFNCQDDHSTDATSTRYWESDTASINSHAWTEAGLESKYIKIRTDSVTGEFSALLPPLKYTTKSVTIDNNRDEIYFTSLSTVDLTQAQTQLSDSIKVVNEQKDTVQLKYKYHAKKVYTHYAKPQLDITEKGHPKGVYGIKTISFKDELNQTTTIDNLWSTDAEGKPVYVMEYPLYNMNDEVTYRLFGYEAYSNYDGAEVVTDSIPLKKQSLRLTNEMSSEQTVVFLVEDETSGIKPGDIHELKDNLLDLDVNGESELVWTVGKPNITSPFTRSLTVSMERKNRTYVVANLNAVVLGSLPIGNNFITKGPDKALFVLRDPPGAKSYTTLKKGVVTTRTKMRSDLAYGDYKIVNNVIAGADLKFGAGLGLIAITSNTVKNQFDWGPHTSFDKAWAHDSTFVTTEIESVSTGAAYPYVGAKGDVYVGYSTNFLIGACRQLLIKRDPETQKYVFALEEAMSLDQEVSTAFKYSQYEIETVMIPKWEDQRASFLTEVADQATADAFKNTGSKTVYLTWLKKDDANYGHDGTYRRVLPEKVTGGERDSVEWCNMQIDRWQKIIKANEEDKVNAISKGDFKNHSIDGGSSYTYSKKNSITEAYDTAYVWKMGLALGDHFGFHAKNFVSAGMIVNINTETGGGVKNSDGKKTENYTEWDYVINEGNRDTDLSFNIYKSKDQKKSDIFYLYGGQTYNPYEGPDSTHYYNKGTPLGNGTEQMEQPTMSISLDGKNASKTITVTDIPAGGEMNLTLHCTNMAHAHQGKDFTYDLILMESTNQKGLQILMDGVPINGRSLLLAQNQTVTKQITIRQTDESVLDYERVMLRFCSQYQPLDIYDDVTINAHFTPSSSPVELAVTEPVLNIETMDRQKGNVELKLKNFNRQFKGLKYIGLQYRYEGNTQWNTLHTYVLNKKDSTGVEFSTLPQKNEVKHLYDMKDDNMFPQGKYQFRAFTTTMYGEQPVSVYSDEVTVVKDNVRPRNLTTPAPANGILRYGDDLVVEFNEDIVPGYVSDKNVIVTAKLNNQPVEHEVSVHLSRRGGGAHTENPIFLNGDFSTDFWLNREGNGTVLQLGMGSNVFSLGFNNGHAEIHLAGTTMVSRETVPENEWTFFALSYKAADHTLSLLAQYGEVNVKLFDNEPVPIDNANAIYYSDDSRLYLGPISARIHDLSLYKVYRDVKDAAAAKYETKDNYVYGLTNYWPMNEGHGDLVADTRHTHDITLEDSWELENTNYCLHTKGETVEADISRINTSRGDSYAIEMWAMSNLTITGGETIFETGSKPSNRLRLSYKANKDIVLEYGEQSQTVVSYEDFANHSGMNHLALNVVRGQSASFYYNGKRTAVIAESEVPPFEGSKMLIGQGLDGFIDEIRIWKATLSEDRLLSNMYNTIDTADAYSRGLVAYYPFEKPGTVNGVSTMVQTLENMAPRTAASTGAADVLAGAVSENRFIASFAPLKNAPEESRIIAKPVASERKLVIRIEEGAGVNARDIEGTTLNITVDKIYDKNGNPSAPIRWTSYVQRNTLKWTKDSVNVIKQYGDAYTFDVNIENRSGNTEYYTLYNMPQWLTLVDSERTDDVAPLTTKTLRFSVNPLVAVGNYDVTIGLQGNNEILEPLRIVMKVSGEAPTWAFDPSKYENTMSIVGQVYVNGILMGNSESCLAAFIGDECRGIAHLEQIRGAAYVAMSVYGNAQQEVNGVMRDLDKGQPLTFRIWDATTGVAYTNVIVSLNNTQGESPLSLPSSQLYFDPVESYGDFAHPVIFAKSNHVEQRLPVKTGWNWLSLAVEPANTKTSAVFKDLSSWNVRVKDQHTGSSYCNGTYWAGVLKDVHSNTMYKMLLSRLPESKELPAQLPVSGEQVKLYETPVVLHDGWNWIAYLPTTTMTLDQALAGANPQIGDQVKSQKGFAYYGPYGWEGNLKALENGKGYLYHSLEKKIKEFVYPTLTTGSGREVKGEKAQDSQWSGSLPLTGGVGEWPLYFSPVDPTTYPDNMSMVIMLTNGGEAVLNAEIAAYVGDECRGAATVTDDLYYLLIAGEGSGQPMELRVSVGGAAAVTVCDTLTYSSDGNIGTPWEPLVIDLAAANGIKTIDGSEWSMSNGQSSMTKDQWYTLQGISLGTARPTHPGVYIFNGQKVVVRTRKVTVDN